MLLVLGSGLNHAVSADVSPAMTANCFACHRHPEQTQGLASIEGRDPRLLNQQLLDFKYGRQPATLMPRILKALSDDEILAIAKTLSKGSD